MHAHCRCTCKTRQSADTCSGRFTLKPPECLCGRKAFRTRITAQSAVHRIYSHRWRHWRYTGSYPFDPSAHIDGHRHTSSGTRYRSTYLDSAPLQRERKVSGSDGHIVWFRSPDPPLWTWDPTGSTSLTVIHVPESQIYFSQFLEKCSFINVAWIGGSFRAEIFFKTCEQMFHLWM